MFQKSKKKKVVPMCGESYGVSNRIASGKEFYDTVSQMYKTIESMISEVED